MLVFDEMQLDSFREVRITEFAEHLSHRARQLHPDKVGDMDHATLVADMRQVIDAARGLDLTKQSQMERFSDLSILFGVGFETTEDWAKEAFSKRPKTPAMRLRDAESTAVFLLRGT